MKSVSREKAQQIAVDLIRKRKKMEDIGVSNVEQKGSVWIIQGTCPINLEGHPWTEKFEVIVNSEGKVESAYFSLL